MNFFCRRFLAVFQDHKCNNIFAQLRMGFGHHRALFNGRMFIQNALHFDRIDVISTSNNHVFGAVREIEIALLIIVTHITGMQPSMAQGFCRGFRVLVVLFHNIWSPQDDFTHLAGLHVLVIRVDNPHFLVRRTGVSDGAELGQRISGIQNGAAGAAFGQQIGVVNLYIRPCGLHLPDHLFGHSSSTGDGNAHRCGVKLFELRMIQKKDEHGRCAAVNGGFFPVHGFKSLKHIEERFQNDFYAKIKP